jgi:hypothetical protein
VVNMCDNAEISNVIHVLLNIIMDVFSPTILGVSIWNKKVDGSSYNRVVPRKDKILSRRSHQNEE